eukprot:CFRG5049T1
MIGKFAQVRLLAWKNFKLQRRRPIGTLVEVLMPIIFICIMVGLKEIVPIETGGPVFNANDQSVNAMPYPNISEYVYYPNSGQVAEIMKYIAEQQGVNSTGFENESEIEEYGRGRPDVVGVIFNKTSNGDLSDNVEVTLRFPYSPKCTQFYTGCADDDSKWYTNLAYSSDGFYDKGPKLTDNSVTDSKYWYSGFARVQWELGNAIASLRNTGTLGSDMQQNIDFRVQSFPFAEFVRNQFATFGIRFTMPLILLLGYTYPILTLTREIVLEKEMRLKEAMKMMGMSASTNWIAWFLKSFILLFISTVVTLIILSVGEVVVYSEMTVIAVFYFAFVLAIIMFGFMLSTFFKSGKMAAPGAAIIFMLTFIPYQILVVSSRGDPSASQVAWSSLFINTAQSWGWMVIGQFEELGTPLSWDKFFSGPSYDSSISMGLIVGMLLFDSFIFGFIAFYVERVFPGEFGVSLPWNFLFTRKYWASSSSRRQDTVGKMVNSQDILADDEGVLEAEESDRVSGVAVHNLVKEYSNGKLAVNGVSFKMYEDDVTCLLGHNGAGKTTTMSMLTGMYEPTSGTATINGYDIRTDIDQCRRVLGLCPQVNTLFTGLTVAEQMEFFGTLKGIPQNEIEKEVRIMLADLDMEEKRDYFPSGLSGGMKRKLCVGIAFMGGSKVVFLDEPTSGMDPQARRSTWDLITKYKQSRTILLTTHFLDEADILGDRVAIMSEGRVKACGTPLFLKGEYGIGYQMVLAKGPKCDEPSVTSMLSKHVAIVLLNNIGAELSYQLPQKDMQNFVPMFKELESNLEELDIQSYGVSCTTLEEVFLKVGESEKDEIGEEGEEMKITAASEHSKDALDVSGKGDEGGYEFENRFLLKSGINLSMKRFKALITKRWINASRDWKVGLSQLLVPVVFCLVALSLGKFAPTRADFAKQTIRLLETDMYFDPNVPISIDESIADNALVQPWKTSIPMMDFTLDIAPETDMLNYLLTKQRTLGQEFLETRLGAYTMTSEVDAIDKQVNVSTWISGESVHSLGVYIGGLAESLIRSNQPDPSTPFKLSFANDPLPQDLQTEAYSNIALDNSAFNIAFFTLFGIVCLTSTYMIFVVNERVSNAKNIQFISGVSPLQYWASTYLWDFTLTIIPNILILALFAAFGIEAYTTGYNLLAMFFLIQLFAWGYIPLTYIVSMGFTSAATAVSVGIIVNYITGLATMIACNVLRNLGLTASDDDTTDYFLYGTLIYYISLLFPNFCLGVGLMDIYKNWQLQDVCITVLSSKPLTLPGLQGFTPEQICTSTKFVDAMGAIGIYYPDERYHSEPNYLAFSAPGIGLPLCVLFLSGFVYFGLLMAIEYNFWLPPREPKIKDSHRDAQAKLSGLYEDDEDVLNEEKRVKSGAADNDVVVLKDLSKLYKRKGKKQPPKLAVDGVTVGMGTSECFGLLGVNGAGKTTTFNMMTGAHPITEGNAIIGGYDVQREMESVRQLIGYCPQFDALIPLMTGRETLRFYGHLRGIPASRLDDAVERMIHRLDLTAHSERACGTYSGGNKRKLSTAMALIGDPDVVFLDEPTTGVDPKTRRFLWDVLIKATAEGRTLVLTSHSMDEITAVSTRVTIMVGGRMRCLGSLQHLRSRFGQGLTAIIKVKKGAETEPIKTFILNKFDGAVVMEEHLAVITMKIPQNDVKWSAVFQAMEDGKEAYNIEDYSVSQTSLEQIFIMFAHGQEAINDSDLSYDREAIQLDEED